MKILLRKFQNKYYVWKNAEYKNHAYWICENGNEMFVRDVDILAVADDDRGNFVQCTHCGAIIKNDPESIEKHFAEQEAKKNCFACDQMSTYGDEHNLKINYTKNEDGTYHIEKNCDMKLGCGYNSWTIKDLDSEEAKSGCQYFQCRVKGVQTVEDIFVRYPGIFNKQITIDLLVKNGFTNRRSSAYHRQWYIDLGLRGNTLYAIVNELGIVDHFVIHHRYEAYTAFYSEKYDKLFFDVGGRYFDCLPGEMSQAKYNSAKRIIKALYKEA